MFRRIMIFGLIAASLFLTGCDQLDTMHSNFNEIMDNLHSDSEPSEDSEDSIPKEDIKVPVSISCSDLAVNNKVSAVSYTYRADSLTFKVTFEDKFSIAETFGFSYVDPTEESSNESNKENSDEQILEVTITDVITLGTFEDLNQCLRVADSSFSQVEYSSDKTGNTFTTTVKEPLLVFKAPIDSMASCKAYCTKLYTDITGRLDKEQAICDGATGIVYHNIGGSEFNLVDYRLFVTRGGETRIEILDLPDGVDLTDISFVSDRVGFATVNREGIVKGINNGSATITVSIRSKAVYRTVYVQVI